MAVRLALAFSANIRSIDRVTLWTTLPSGVAWACLLAVSNHHDNSLRASLSGGDTPLFATDLFAAAAEHWFLMIAAMMLPLLVVPIRQVAFRSYRWRRGRAIAGFLAGYGAAWMFAGAGVMGFLLIPDVAALIAVPATGSMALLAAAGWQLSPWRAAAMRKCHRSVALTPRGAAADLDCMRFGISHGAACITVCLPLMLAVMSALPGIAPAMILALLLYFERAYQRIHQAVPAIALVCVSAVIALSS